MGMHSIDELIRLYTLEKITLEQTTGQILQHLQKMNESLERMWKLEQEIERVKAFVGMEEGTKGSTNRRRVNE